MNEKEHRTENVNFRISPRYKKYLEELCEISGLSSPSEYLNNLILLKRRSLIFDKAMNESKLTLGEKVGFNEEMSKGIDGPEIIEKVFKGEIGLNYVNFWFEEFKKSALKDAVDIGAQDIADFLSTENGKEILHFFFSNSSKLRQLNSIADEISHSAKKQKAGG
jgi:hypothetical protein